VFVLKVQKRNGLKLHVILTSTLEVSAQFNAPAALLLGRNPVATNWEAHLTPEPVWTVWRR
jgi:hypothetical protein